MSLISREDAIKELMSWLPKLENGLIHWTGVKAMLENLPAVNPDGWISVEDRPPDNNTDFLLQFKSNMGVGFYEDGDWAINTGDGIYSLVGYNEEKPIAWRELPKPYEPQEG